MKFQTAISLLEKFATSVKIKSFRGTEIFDIDIYKNPSRVEIDRVTTKISGIKFVRGALDPSFNLYVWSGDIIHSDIQKKVNFKLKWRFVSDQTGPKKDTIEMSEFSPIDPDHPDMPKVKKTIKKFFGNKTKLEIITTDDKLLTIPID